MATIKLRDYLASLSSKGSTALNDKITILDSADGSKIKTVLKSDLVDLTFLAAELRDDLKDDFLNTFGDDVISGSIQIDHDGTTNFVANEHIDHTGVTITAGTGLTGGGDISTNRTINVVSANNGIIANADNIELDNTSSVFTTGVTTHITSADLDMAGNKVLFANVYATEGDLPSAATYHGMFAHVHATGKGYYAHGGAWIKLLDESFSASLDNSYASDSQLTAVSSAFDSTINALDGTYASDSQLTAVSSAFDSTINGLTTADVSEDSSNKYYTDVRVKAKLTAEDVVSGSNSDVKTFLGISASDISDVEAFSQSGTYSGLRAQSTTAGDVDLGNVTNESKATMFTDATLTGNSTAPSQSVSDNSTKIATTEFVQARITDIIGNAGSTLDTLGELSASLAEDSGSLSTLTTTVGTKLAKASNLSDLQDAATARGNLGVDASGTVNYVLPTDLDGDDIDIDTTALTGATVISDLDINITTDTSGRVTDANGSVATRTLTAANLGLGSSDDVVFNTITGSGIEITGVTNYNGLTIKAGGGSRPGINFENVNQGQLGGIYGTEANSLGLSTQGGIQYVVRNANGASGDHLFNSYNTTILKLDGGTNESVFAGNISTTGSLSISGDGLNPVTFTESGNGLLTIAAPDDIVLDAEGHIVLDANSGETQFKDGGTSFLEIANSSSDAIIRSTVQDKDILFNGNDNGSAITALQLDMSNGGSATFRDDIDLGGKITQTGTGTNKFGGKIGIGITPVALIHITGSGDAIRVESTNAGAGGAQIDLLHFSPSPDDNDVHGVINMGGYYDGTTTSIYGSSIKSIWTDASARDAHLSFHTVSSGTLTEKFQIQSSGQVRIGNYATANAILDVQYDAAVYNAPRISDTRDFAINQGAGIDLMGRYSSTDTQVKRFASIYGKKENGTDNNTDGYLQFQTNNVERARITSLGEVQIGTATVNSNGLTIEKTGNHIFLRASSAGTGEYWNFDVTSNNELGILQDNGAGISIKDSGVLQTPNGIVLNSNTVTGNKTSVTFNDYEEGTWTPTITDLGGNAATLSSALGTYTKIGRQVILNYKVVLSSKGSMTGNYVHIGALPFNHAAGSAVGTGTVDFFKNMANSFSSLAWDITSTVTVGWLTGVDGTGAASSVYLTVAKLTDTTELKGSLIYTT